MNEKVFGRSIKERILKNERRNGCKKERKDILQFIISYICIMFIYKETQNEINALKMNISASKKKRKKRSVFFKKAYS